jgi:response regulator RpfG family c-di-GMP phosphodiesterase
MMNSPLPSRLLAWLKKTARKPKDLADSMVLLAIVLAASYWGLESLLNVFSPEDISFYRQIFGPDVSEIWMRIIALCLFVIFGSHVQYTINNRKKAEEKLLASYRHLQNARTATILGLAKLAEYRDEGTGLHLERIREYAKLLADEMSKLPRYREYITPDYIEDLYHSSILHDIGKVGIPDAILLKPGPLSEAEFQKIKQHTVLGGDAIDAIESNLEGRSFLYLGKRIAYSHHEKWNGSGYPRGLKGEAIPLSARIVSLADVYDALTTKRFYKEAFSHEKAKRIIVRMRDDAFDPEMVDAFLRREADFDKIRAEKMEEVILPEVSEHVAHG